MPMRLRGGKLPFDPEQATLGLERLWDKPSSFGMEAKPYRVYLDEIISDRFCLTKGSQLIRDELQLSFNLPQRNHTVNTKLLSHLFPCAADLSLPSVLSTCAYTVCGDRICQTNALKTYQLAVAGRFASFTEHGESKPELFFATGGGTDSGPTLAHVTYAHSIDPAIRTHVYNGNAKSFVLVNIDICTHCGHLDVGKGNQEAMAGKVYRDVGVVYGKAQESLFRDARAACGAIVGMLSHFSLANGVHVRLRRDLGEENYAYLTKNDILADDGSPVTFLVAAAIISIQGMKDTLQALGPGGELDQRGMGHLTANVLVNNEGERECLMYCARGTVFNGEMRIQGLGTDASKYSAKMKRDDSGHCVVQLLYNGSVDHPIESKSYNVRKSEPAQAFSPPGFSKKMGWEASPKKRSREPEVSAPQQGNGAQGERSQTPPKKKKEGWIGSPFKS